MSEYRIVSRYENPYTFFYIQKKVTTWLGRTKWKDVDCHAVYQFAEEQLEVLQKIEAKFGEEAVG